jgi:hypothetical protein
MLDATYANMITNARLGTASFVAPVTPVHARLMVVNGTATVNGTELATSGGYTGGTGAPVISFASASGEQAVSNVAVTVPNMPACTIVGIELWDSSGSPRRLEVMPLTASKTVNLGDTFNLAAGQVISNQT